MVGKLLDHKALKVSEAQGAAGVAKRYEQVIASVDKLATKYFYDLATGRQLETHEDEGTITVDEVEQELVLDLPTDVPTMDDEDFDDDFE